ncbi:MAG: DUF3488 and transglutaminase-like domain-containing protein [Acidimicrobiia bacterium]
MIATSHADGVDALRRPPGPPDPSDEATTARDTRTSAQDAFTRAGALGLVSVATALGFGRIFSGAGFVATLLVAAVLPHVVGGFARMRRWSAALTVALTGTATALALVEIVAGETTAYGLPTADTARRVGHLLDVGWSVFRTGVAPVAAHRGVVLLCAIAVAACATAADAIGRREDTTVGALGPTLVLFVLTGTLGSGDLRVPTTIGYVASALTAMVIANASRLTHRRTWFTGRRLASDAAVLRSAAGLGAAALLAGLVVTPLIPGVDSAALLRYRNHRGTGGGGLGDFQTVSPLVDLRQRLGAQSNNELFRVVSPRPLYWRLVALDRFDGQVWSVTSEARDAATAFRNQSKRNAVRQDFDITGLGDQWVPAAFSPVSTTMGNARIIPESATLIAPNPIPGQRYEVLSRVETPPTPTEILATNRAVPPQLTRALELPSDFPSGLRRQARDITAGATTPYAKAEALRQFFRGDSFTYDLSVPPGDNSEAIGAFLRIRRGFCQQFAAAFAALARAAGLPARVVVGFTPGDLDTTTNQFVVRGRNAHAWAEVWFAGLGWRTFEPTPAGSEPGQADPRVDAVPPPPISGGSTTTTTVSAPTPSVQPGASNAGAGRRPSEIISTTSRSNGTSSPLRTVAAIAIPGLVLLAGLVAVIGRVVARRRTRHRRRRAPDPVDRMAGAWREALEACARAGLPVSGALTPNEQVESLANHGVPTPAVPALRELAQLSTDLTFSPIPPDDDAVDRGWEAVEEVRDALLVGVGVRERAGRALRRSELPV